MIVGVPKEIKNEEYRVAMTPNGAKDFVRAGHTVVVEAGAGVGSGFSGRSKLKRAWDGDLVSVIVPFEPPQRIECEVKCGDTVLYERHQQHEFYLHGETYDFVFEEQFIAAIIDSDTIPAKEPSHGKVQTR